MASKWNATQIGLHSVRNLLGEPAQLELLSDRAKEIEELSFQLSGTITRLGVDLTDLQSKVMEGILRGFTETKYQGNIAPKSKELSSGTTDQDHYKHIVELPCLKASQNQILEWSGINKKSIAAWTRAVEAIKELGTIQYCFYYDRLVYSPEGQPIREPNGRWKKEEVITVDTLFTVKEIRDNTTGDLKHYEITPSQIFLDQRESYFMLIPFNWREEVKQLVGAKKASSYTFRFLIFLRYQYARLSRNPNRKRPFDLKWSPEEIAAAIKMPESISKRKKKLMMEILEDAYNVAKRLGYLANYERTTLLDILTFNSEKYFDAREIDVDKAIGAIGVDSIKNEHAIELFEFFHNLRLQVDKYHKKPEGHERIEQIADLQDVLKERPIEDIKQLLNWAQTNPFWGSSLITPRSLKKLFPRAWAELKISSSKTDSDSFETHKQLALEHLSKLEDRNDLPAKVSIGSNYVEFYYGGQSAPIIIQFGDPKFKAKIHEQLQRIRL